MYDYLKKVPLFAGLTDDDLERLCQDAEEITLKAGSELFAEGTTGDKAYVIQQGQIEIIKHSGERSVLLAVRQNGDVIGEMSLLEASPRYASARARTDSVLLAISHIQLDNLLNVSPLAARSMLYTFVARLRSTELTLQQSEKMAQLGTLTAGIAHELNNPAAAVQRGAHQLQTAVNQLHKVLFQIRDVDLDGRQRAVLLELDQMARQRASQPIAMEILERSDRENELEAWLDELGVANSWEVAPTLVGLGFTSPELNTLSETFHATQLPTVIQWLCNAYTVYTLLEELSVGSGRISEIVKALKTYVYLDQAPIGLIDVHEGLDNTLVMLRSRLKVGVSVKREYGVNIPRIHAYGSELNQVWTNIIDNAIDAMDGKGEIVIKTHFEEPWVVIEIEDNGPGIPQEIQSKIFNPFFTTKAVGKGTGLGLNISSNIIQKHAGEIRVYSRPGKTRFLVSLPVNFEAAKTGENLAHPLPIPSDDALRSILQQTATIAVVGISDRPERPAYSVPAFLQAHGYRIIPVNPNLDTVLGEKAYPDLVSIPHSVDVVLVFRRSEAVPQIVEEAIQINAKVVWMQEGIIHQMAAESARIAGMQVVMDTCMRSTYKRLIGP